MNYEKQFEARWADVDLNGHMRHSAYVDYGAHVRVKLFEDFGFPLTRLFKMGIGPVLFREETIFRQEIKLHEPFSVNCELKAARPSGKIWKLQHTIFKSDRTVAAVITAEGAWLDLTHRRVITPPEELTQLMQKIDKTRDFEELKE